MFLDWELRGSFTSIEEMLFGLQISEDDFDKSCTEERLLDYIQFLLNAIIFVSLEVKKRNYTIYQVSDSIYSAIVDNSHLILDKVGAEMVEMGHEIAIAYKDDVANAAAMQVPDISSSIREYLLIDNRGDLQKKAEILGTLAKELEKVEGRFKGTEFSTLCSDTTMLLNKTGIRHAMDSRDKIETKFLAMNEQELETWYDMIFHMFLACVSVLPYLEVKNEIREIKS